MSGLDEFYTVWSNARSTMGQGHPQDGAQFDNSSALRQMQTGVEAAAPGSRWTGAAADAYSEANSTQARVLGHMAGLDQRLGAEVDRSAAVVIAGRRNLDEIKQWVQDAASTVPPGADREQALIPIARKGISDVSDVIKQSNGDLSAIGERIRAIGEEYRALGGPKEGKGPGEPGPGDPEPVNKYEQALRDAGLLTGPSPDGYYKRWLENAERNGVPPQEIVKIAREQHITPDSFKVLEGMEEIKDKEGKSFFLIPNGMSPADMQKATLMTYILNAGTGYGKQPPGVQNDFPETPYSAAEVQRIVDRQNANGWSYDEAWVVNATGGSLVTTPNGMLMGLGGWPADHLSVQGGNTHGDVFLANIDRSDDPAEQLRDIVHSGNSWQMDSHGKPYETALDLDRVLHHEERHSQQWARLGPVRMSAEYIAASVREKLFGTPNKFEVDAGLHDGGYE